MEMTDSLYKRWVGLLIFAALISSLAIVIAGILLPSITFLVALFSGLAIFRLVYSIEIRSGCVQDIILIVCLIAIGLFSTIVLGLICALTSGLTTCSPNNLRAQTFAHFSFVFLPTIVLWLFTRLPALLKTLR